MPTTITSVVIFAVLLLPGLAYVYEVERRKAVPKLSSFRETSIVLTVSLVNFAFASLVTLLLSIINTDFGDKVDEFFRAPKTVLLSEPRAFLACLVFYLVASTCVTATAGHYDLWGHIRRRATGPESILQVAGWTFALDYDLNATKYDASVVVRATVYLKDGSRVQGQVLGHTASVEDDQEASITIGVPLKMAKANGEFEPVTDLDKIVVHSNEISFVGFKIKKPKNDVVKPMNK
ncbi:DUF6338 family protein [Glutamicibacter sp. X7]